MSKDENNSNKCPICGRATHKESKYCIFHASAEEKTEEEFKSALKKFIEEIKLKNIVYDFMGFVFIGNNDFRKDYNVKQFNNLVRFDSAIFHGKTSFSGITFNDYAIFMRTTFHEDAEFIGVNFQNDAIFNYANFNKVHFNATNFKWKAIFNDSSFKWAFFPLVNFYGNAEFWNLKKLERMHFTEAKFSSGISALFGFKEGKATFNDTLLENISLSLKLGKDAKVDFKNTRLRNTNIKRKDLEGHIIQENEGDYIQTKEIYLLIKNNFHSIGRYDDESWAFQKEKEMERKSFSFFHYKNILKEEDKKEKFPILKWIKKGDLKKWITSAFSNMVYGYGEKPWNVVKTALAIIIIFAISFSLIGLGNPEIIELKGTAIRSDSGNIVDLASKGLLKNNVIRNFPDSLYFSTITFTTLGYGDFRPLEGLGRILAGSEAFIGAFMMALFVYTFARRTGGR